MKRIVSIVLLLLVLLSAVSCDLEPGMDKTNKKGNITYDENGNKIREDVYNRLKELEWYTLYEYYNDNSLKKTSTYKVHANGDIMVNSQEFKYDENGQKIREEKYAYNEDTGEFSNHDTSDYYNNGVLKTHTIYNQAGHVVRINGFSEEGYAILTESWQYHQTTGTLLGGTVEHHNKRGDVTRLERYDADKQLISCEIHSYDENGSLTGELHENADGEATYETSYDENGALLSAMEKKYHSNGALATHMVKQRQDEYIVVTTKTYDIRGQLLTTRVAKETEHEGEELEYELYNAKNLLIAYKYADKSKELFYDRAGNLLYAKYAQYYPDGSLKMQEERDSQDRRRLYQEFFSDGMPFKNEIITYHSNGVIDKYTYTEDDEKGDRVTLLEYSSDAQGNIIDKNQLEYDEFGNCSYSERIEDGVLRYKSSEIAYPDGQCQRREQYSCDEMQIMIIILEYDENNREIYDERSEQLIGQELITTRIKKYAYDTADRIIREEVVDRYTEGDRVIDHVTTTTYAYDDHGNIIKKETVSDGADQYDHSITEYYSDGSIKRIISYAKDGTQLSRRDYDEHGTIIFEERLHQKG